MSQAVSRLSFDYSGVDPLVTKFAEARATQFSAISKSWSNDTIKMGRILSEVRDKFKTTPVHGVTYKRPKWKEWLATRLSIGPKQATDLIRVYKTFGREGLPSTHLSSKVLVFLARKTTPKEAVQKIISDARKGTRASFGRAKKIANKHRPSPTAARELARKSKRGVIGSDGRIYFGATKEQQLERARRRRQTYAIRDAIETIFNTHGTISASDWVKQAQSHWLHDFPILTVPDVIEWLEELRFVFAKEPSRK
jgi:hypothetical protein